MKDFNPNKTQLCITAATFSPASSRNEPTNVVSKSRTLKVMRSALAGIPLLTPSWVDACLKEGHIVAPSGTMCIRSLPRKHGTAVAARRKVDRGIPTENFGVARYAANVDKTPLTSSDHLLSGFSVMLCGSSAGSGMVKDLKVLLQQAGAAIVGSASAACRQLADMEKVEPDCGLERSFVFLCDDSPTDKTCGITDTLFKQVKRLIVDSSNTGGTEKVRCVHFNWLFDSISCASPMKASSYEPVAPRTRALWNLTTENRVANNNSNREKSQIY